MNTHGAYYVWKSMIKIWLVDNLNMTSRIQEKNGRQRQQGLVIRDQEPSEIFGTQPD